MNSTPEGVTGPRGRVARIEAFLRSIGAVRIPMPEGLRVHKNESQPASNRPLVTPREPERESRQVRRRRLFLGAAAEIESLYGVTGAESAELVGYHEGFPRRARRRAARTKARRLFAEVKA